MTRRGGLHSICRMRYAGLPARKGSIMPFVNNKGTRIHYEVEGTGPPLVLQHGTLGSGKNWEEYGYTEILKLAHQLILVDARGHGASDKPYDPAAYELRLRVEAGPELARR